MDRYEESMFDDLAFDEAEGASDSYDEHDEADEADGYDAADEGDEYDEADEGDEYEATSFDEGDAQHHPFRAYKNNSDFYGGVPASRTLEAGSYLGQWFMDRNGQRGWLRISSVNAASGAVLGSFTPLNGDAVSVTGVIGQDRSWIELNFGGTQRLLGLMHSHLHAISGMGSSDGASFGFWAVRSQEAFGSVIPGDAATEQAPVTPPVCQVISSFPMCE